MPIDFHLHTRHSDGTFAPEEVIRRAKSLKMTAISITDHDTLSALPAARRGRKVRATQSTTQANDLMSVRVW